jgi:membrane-associated phospholipid phosphatase
MWATGAIVINGLDPLTYEEIYALDPEDVNKFDRGAIGVRRETQAGDTLVSASIFLPLTFIASGAVRKDMGMLGVMAVEVLMLNQGLNWMAKGLARRTRPFVYEPESPHEDKTKTNARLSFFSGHTSTAASMTFFTAKVFSDYLSSKTAKALIWTAAAVYPALVGYLRRDSANHFRTDVMTGYIVGALIGYGIPLLHKVKPKDLSISPVVSTHQIGLALRYQF